MSNKLGRDGKLTNDPSKKVVPTGDSFPVGIWLTFILIGVVYLFSALYVANGGW